VNEYERSIKRVVDNEERRADITGFGSTRQGRALIRRYQKQLAETINADRVRRGVIWMAMDGLKDDDDLAICLLFAGLSACARNDGQTFRDTALCIGGSLGQRGKLALKVGVWGIQMLLTLPIFTLEDGDVLTLRLTDSLDNFLDGVLERYICAHPSLLPLTEPPAPWEQIDKGAISQGHWARPSLIEHHPLVENAMRWAIYDGSMKGVLRAVNSLQAAPCTINRHILKLLLRLPAPHVPDPPNPGLPHRERWKAEQEWREARARALAWQLDLATAETLADYTSFYVPLKICFRGRVYPIPHFGFPREDHVRGLFLFARGERIGDEGLLWLMAHVAARADGNEWSNNKKPSRLNREGRIAWTKANLSRLRQIGEAVLNGELSDDLSNIDDRFQLAAACVELVQALDIGPEFITHLPLTFDGSCSGLQRLCAMTRAEEGRFVNLTAADEAEDFYTHVARKVYETCADLMQGADDRASVKQPCMTYFYGSRAGGFDNKGRPYAMTEQVCSVLKERGQPTTGAKRLADAIYKTIEGMVPSTKEVRDFLEQLVKICAKNSKVLRWPTALGLPVLNCYYKPEIKIISLKLDGRRRRVKFVVGDTDEIDRRKAINSVTANFVHSADAAHLQMIALAAEAEGIAMVAVHDSFGCLAPHAKRFNEIIREQFLRLHTDFNWLAAVRESARRDLPRNTTLPPLPKTGSLDLRQVLESDHAFK
jgi:DNA-directed RNA polymerase